MIARKLVSKMIYNVSSGTYYTYTYLSVQTTNF